MYVGNVMLVILNLPLIGIWVRFLTIPYTVLAPLIMGFIISEMVEGSFIRSLLMSNGSFWIFFTRPMSRVLMVVAIALFILPFFGKKPKALGSSVDES